MWMLQFHPPRPSETLLVAIPSKQKANHSMGLATALAQMTGWTVCNPLVLERSQAHQRRLGRGLRQQRQFGLKEAIPEGRPILVVDDIVTTGSTGHAAFKALGSPQNMEFWCLMDRRPCGHDMALL